MQVIPPFAFPAARVQCPRLNPADTHLRSRVGMALEVRSRRASGCLHQCLVGAVLSTQTPRPLSRVRSGPVETSTISGSGCGCGLCLWPPFMIPSAERGRAFEGGHGALSVLLAEVTSPANGVCVLVSLYMTSLSQGPRRESQVIRQPCSSHNPLCGPWDDSLKALERCVNQSAAAAKKPSKNR